VLDSILAAFDGPGAPFLYVLTAMAAYGLAVTLERSWCLVWRWGRLPDATSTALEAGELALAVSAAAPHPVAGVLAAGASQATAEAAWEAMGVATVEAEQRVHRRVASLGAVGNLTTMIGLLGTVYGLMLAFGALGDATAGERAARLSEGIATAMSTTACGLLVAIPCLGAHAWLEGRAEAVMAQIEAAAGRLALAKRRSTSGG
jgi:biopolymer transport protein ExbB